MPRKFSLVPDQYESPSIGQLRDEWRNIPDTEVRNVISVEAQYLAFHRYLLESLRHESLQQGNPIPIGLSVRAGALKTATLLCASIAEAALRSHAERRNYQLPSAARRRTFGTVLQSWLTPTGHPHPDVLLIWPQLQRLHTGRNTVHLYATIELGGNFYDILQVENESLTEAENVLEHIRNIVTN